MPSKPIYSKLARIGCALTFLSCADAVHAISPANAPPPGTTANGAAASQDANDHLTKQFGPFNLSFGPNADGGFGANLTGNGRKDFGALNAGHQTEDVRRLWLFPFPDLIYSASGAWNSNQNSPNNASLSLKPGFDGVVEYGMFHTSKFKPPLTGSPTKGYVDAEGHPVLPDTYPSALFGIGGSGDLEFRYGTFKQTGTGASSTPATAREFLVGAQLYTVALGRNRDLGLARVLASPRASVSYYHPSSVTTTSNIPLPDGIRADYLQTSLETVLGFGPAGQNTVKLDVKYDGSKPTTGQTRSWESLWTVKLWIPGLKFNGVNPSVTYQSGKNGGFTYDRQVLLGVLLEFLDPNKT